MTVDYFLIDGPHSVPVEFQAWTDAKDRYMAIFRAWGAAAADSDEIAELDRAGRAAQAVADDLERVARAAWDRVNAQTRLRP